MDLCEKYRPRCYSQVAGQSHIVSVLRNRKDLKAILLSGPPGVGKTTLARIYAMDINCDKGVEECKASCKSCQSILKRTTVDFLEENVADARGIDDMRRVVEWLQFRPMTLKYKIAVLDEAHMLTPQAQNVLLKVVEEPPPHARIIFCTTDSSKMIPTLVQRCVTFVLTPVSVDDSMQLLKRVISQEMQEGSVVVDEHFLTELKKAVELSGGSPRKLLKMLEAIIGGGTVDGVLLEEEPKLVELVKCLDSGDFVKLIDVYKKLNKVSTDSILAYLQKVYANKLIGAKSDSDFEFYKEVFSVLDRRFGHYLPDRDSLLVKLLMIVRMELKRKRMSLKESHHE